MSIMLGESDLVLAGGIESMSRMPYLIDSVDARWGHRIRLILPVVVLRFLVTWRWILVTRHGHVKSLEQCA